MHTFSISSKYIFNSTASLNLTQATAILSSASTSAPTSAPTPNAAPLPPTDAPTTSLPAIGVGKDIIINSIAIKGNIECSSYYYRGKLYTNRPTEDSLGKPLVRAYRRLNQQQ
jgi:hypothetical protein